MTSYRYYQLDSRNRSTRWTLAASSRATSWACQLPLSNRPQVPWYLVAGVTTNITSNTTNDFHYSFLRNWWQWGTAGDPGTVCTAWAAPLSRSAKAGDNVLAPYNVNTQQTRTRFWDGKDHMFRDDVSMLKGNHLFQFGGTYQHNFNWHQRTDNGGGINYQPVYQLGTTQGCRDGRHRRFHLRAGPAAQRTGAVTMRPHWASFPPRRSPTPAREQI